MQLVPLSFLSKHIKNHCDIAILSHYVMWSTEYWHIEYPNLSLKTYSTKPYFIQRWMRQRLTINDQGFYNICWKSLSKTMISTMNPINKELRNFLLISLFSTICFSKTLVVVICWIDCIQQWIRQRIRYWHTKKSWTKSEAKGIMALHQFPAKNLMI